MLRILLALALLAAPLPARAETWVGVLGGRYEIRLPDGFARNAGGGFSDLFVSARYAKAYEEAFGQPPAGDSLFLPPKERARVFLTARRLPVTGWPVDLARHFCNRRPPSAFQTRWFDADRGLCHEAHWAGYAGYTLCTARDGLLVCIFGFDFIENARLRRTLGDLLTPPGGSVQVRLDAAAKAGLRDTLHAVLASLRPTTTDPAK